jgi:hypothetical protein
VREQTRRAHGVDEDGCADTDQRDRRSPIQESRATGRKRTQHRRHVRRREEDAQLGATDAPERDLMHAQRVRLEGHVHTEQ